MYLSPSIPSSLHPSLPPCIPPLPPPPPCILSPSLPLYTLSLPRCLLSPSLPLFYPSLPLLLPYLPTVDFPSLRTPLPPFQGNLWFVRAIGCNVKSSTAPTIYFPGMGPRNLKGSEIDSTSLPPSIHPSNPPPPLFPSPHYSLPPSLSNVHCRV